MGAGRFRVLCVGAVFDTSEILDCDHCAALFLRCCGREKRPGSSGLGKRDWLGPGGDTRWICGGTGGGSALRNFALHAEEIGRLLELEARSSRRRGCEE